MSACILILCVGYAAILIKAYFDGKFDSVESLRQYIEGYGIWAPLALITLQAMQVIVPILPGFLGCAVGAVMFGCMGGFWCNYIGISLGSLIAFLLARHYGRDFVQDLFPKDKYDKFSSWAAHSKSYTALLFAGMILPLFPDDFFCYFSGLTKMTFRKFFWIIVIGKPWCLLAYSYGFSFI
ncbi:MAG: TVP38/TMEM64 family protein [Lachnospiraceae bacterium]|nr:TVP38/TMEM64 family protein [Lachnospiraceae bacterium]